MNKKNMKSLLQKLTMGMSGVMAAAFLFAAMPVQVEAVTIGSSPSGTSAIVNEDGSEGASASQVGSVTVTANDVNIRSDASTSASKVGQASSGTEATVSGEKTDSSGKTWYAISFEQDGKTITGYIREDFVQTHAAEVVTEEPVEETVAEEEEPAVQEEAPAPADDYYVQYSTDESGAGAWYLHDNTMGTRYQVSELLAAEETNANNAELMESQTGKLKMVIVIMAAVILVLIVLVTVFIIKLRNAYDDDDYDDEDEMDEEEEEEEEEEERPRRRLFSRRSRYEEEDEDEDEEDEEEEEEEYRPSRRAAKPAVKEKRRSRYEEEDEDEEEEEEYRPRRSAKSSKGQNDKNWQSKNFLDDDDLEFEFLDLK